VRFPWPASRRARGLSGLVASVLIGAGAIGAWAAWSVPSPVELAPPTGPASRAPAPPASATSRPMAAPTARAPVAAVSTASGHRPETARVTGVTAASPPVALVIPAIGVNARVVPEDLGPGGALDIPPPQQVGWYDRGPAPDQSGTTMLAGHIDDNGVPGALLRLNDVQLGAAIRVTTASGRVAAYTVTRRQVLPQHELAYSGLLSQQGAPSLVLVSCGGAYDEATHLYLDNIVVVATPVR
jgi:Sortase domain